MTRILYLRGFASGPFSQKARYFTEHFARTGLSMEVPDLAAPAFGLAQIWSERLGPEQFVAAHPNARLEIVDSGHDLL